MATQGTIQESQDLYQMIVAEYRKNDHFKDELENNPVQAIERATGKKCVMHADTKIVVEDQSDESIVYLNIPRKVDLENFELTDEQLEMVAGGIAVVTLSVGAAIGIVAGVIIVGTAVGVGIAWLLD